MLRDLSWLKRVKLIDKDSNLIDNNNPLPVLLRQFYKVDWISDTDFNKGSLTDVEVIDSGDEAYLQLEENADNSDDVPFTTPSNYSYNPTEIEFSGGMAQLKSTITESNDWPFTTPANYNYDTNKIEVTGGVAKLKGVPVTPYAWYHLNESSGSVASDSSGNGRNGTTVNSPSWVSGKLNNCLTLNGTNQYVNLGNIANFERTDSFSLEAWVKTTKIGEDILTKYSTKGYIFYVASGGKIYFTVRNTAGTNEASRYSQGAVASGNWTHIVVTYDGSSSNTGIKIYINGVDDTDITSGVNTLSATIITSTQLDIGGRGSSGNFSGDIDEVVVYDKTLSASEVLARYNSGSGTESMPGVYDTSNPTVYPSTGFAFTSEITEFTSTSTKPTDTEIKFHVSADDGVTWKYWNGSNWVATNDSYSQANIASEVHSNIESLASSGTFKFRALLHTDDESKTPELDNIYIAVATYASSGEIEMNWDIQPTYNFEYLSITETVIEPTDTNIKYQYSIDSGSSYNGSWLTASELQTALQGISCVGDGSDKIRFKFQLSTTDANHTPQIDNLNITSDAGYKTSGEFESNIFNSNFYSLDWNTIYWQINIPSGCSVIIKAKASDDYGDLGLYSNALSNGEELTVSGRYIQWKLEFIGNGKYTPKLQELYINYAYPYTSVAKP